uniref:Uncharacterized protein n=1 Tax=Utricularia reniformis TaxID=192314 RepID=A0A1Y0AZV4_9LAMI|nr:hypothetical protein AEK19_MT0391 [Utricularia reniformis]ART30661.1 hypothetical protein AEK19_MT0391 [Utricularia reniformis]
MKALSPVSAVLLFLGMIEIRTKRYFYTTLQLRTRLRYMSVISCWFPSINH